MSLNPLHQYLMVGKLVALLGAIAIICWQSSQIHRWHKHYESERTAHQRDIDAYRAAQAQAAAANKAQVARVKQQQQEITDATVSRLSARLELIRGELRKPAPQGAANGPGAGDPGQAPCRAFDPAWMCLSPDDRLRAAENEERHDELIDWAISQSKVKP